MYLVAMRSQKRGECVVGLGEVSLEEEGRELVPLR